jgi:hypothetical protein
VYVTGLPSSLEAQAASAIGSKTIAAILADLPKRNSFPATFAAS